VTMVHAENGHCVHWLSGQLERSSGGILQNAAASSPASVEREAVHRAITLAEISGARMLLVHVSSADATEQIQWAHRRGMPVLAETCPQYLVKTVDELDRPGWEAAKYICSPPLRPAEDADELWRGLGNGAFQLVSSDHCPYRYEGDTGKRAGAKSPHFRHVAPGLPGIETRLMLLFGKGVQAGRITLEQFVALTSTNPAKIYGLYPRKGSLMPGADADIVLWDGEARGTVRHADLHDACDYTPYEGEDIHGLPVMTLSRGECIWRRGEVLGAPGRGRFAERSSA